MNSGPRRYRAFLGITTAAISISTHKKAIVLEAMDKRSRMGKNI